ncbi:hypothetical protein GPA10_04375 [Streptomyces sp. p1417]|uniref:PH domain-containing protein n=1 Tax=Streptomyces typhae TaxID=2681492 RepID=A0A6L6WP68_9ACTN|nr:hypothetical protein [Streptomyces typhae]MVO84022.1 hypothetical protein [Streptomyces typhae]
MRYYNRPVRRTSWAIVAIMAVVAAQFLYDGGAGPRDVWDVVLALALPGGVTWVLVRTGLTPYVEWDEQRLTVRNPFFRYEASLADVRLLGRAGKGGALGVEGVGTVLPWAMTRSVFDGRRAEQARRELRNAVRRAVPDGTGTAGGAGTPGGTDAAAPVRRHFRVEWTDVLILPMLGAFVWAFLP